MIIAIDNCKYKNGLSFEELRYLKILMRNKNIIIQKASTVSNTVVINYKEKYIQGVKNVISDSSKFNLLNIPLENYINYIVNVKKKIRKLFNYLYDNNKISKDEFLKISPVASRPGNLYGNPKVHKSVADNMPKFIPILSAINSPGYNLFDTDFIIFT